MTDQWGVWSNWSKKWCFGIAEPTKRKASKALFDKIGKHAYRWRFEYKKIPLGVDPKTSNQKTAGSKPVKKKGDMFKWQTKIHLQNW